MGHDKIWTFLISNIGIVFVLNPEKSGYVSVFALQSQLQKGLFIVGYYCKFRYKNKNKNKNKNFLLPIKGPQGANNLIQ